MISFEQSETVKQTRDLVHAVARDAMRPISREFDEREHEKPWDFLKMMWSVSGGRPLGTDPTARKTGPREGNVAACVTIEELSWGDAGLYLSIPNAGLGGAAVLAAGTPEQKERFLSRFQSGDPKWGAMAITEPHCGSDSAALQTTAVRDGDHWVLNGTKQFITHGRDGDLIVVMAVTTRGKGSRGISAFIVERGTPGFRAGKKEDKLGMRASETSEVVFENCRVPESQLLGVEGQGFVNALQVLDAGRIGIAALAVGLAQGAYEAARSYAFTRVQFGQKIGTFQSIRARLVDTATRIEAARLLTYRAAALKDVGARTTIEAAMAKLYSSEIAVRAAEDGVQIHGGYGFVKDYPAEKFFRDVKLTTIGEGTSEIQRLVIARHLMAGDRDAGGRAA